MIGNPFSLTPFLDPLCCMALCVHSTWTHVNLIYERVSSTSHGKHLRRRFGGSLLHSSQRVVSWSLEMCRDPNSQAREQPLIYTQRSTLTRSKAKQSIALSSSTVQENQSRNSSVGHSSQVFGAQLGCDKIRRLCNDSGIKGKHGPSTEM